MNRRLLLGLTLILLLSVLRASALEVKHLQGFHVVKNLPQTMAAGETVDWQVSFVNPKSEAGILSIMLEIDEENNVGLGEFSVEGVLESYDNPPRQHHYTLLNFVESQGGVFQCEAEIHERFNLITLTTSSVPNLMYGHYTFTLSIQEHLSQASARFAA
ncbi:MAG: hypothetical protein OEY30_00260 [Candidatus Bathyarchaeota archaeon]|nr:hypothetical protein [Candidatus Bathyarchaeota archaeon]